MYIQFKAPQMAQMTPMGGTSGGAGAGRFAAVPVECCAASG